MCGICGFTEAAETDKNILKDMCDQIIHRGPDGSGLYIKDGIAFGHRRLSLVDIEHGNQPIIRQNANKDCDVWHGKESNFEKRGDFAIVMNGEIYNFKDIRDELIELGYTFKTQSDTETILVGYTEWGPKILDKIRGMFAIVIWNSNNQELFCARDPFGIKPFYYTIQDKKFIFSSEIKALLKHPNCPKQLNKSALEQYLCFQFSALQESFFKDIYSLPQGHYMILDKNCKIIKKCFFRPKFEVDKNGNSTSKNQKKYNYNNHEELVNNIDKEMRKSIKYHNIADVEIGSLLSSGIDSSYNASLLSQLNPNTKTFTVGFDAYSGKDDKYQGERNEISWAKELADKLNIENYSETIKKEDYWNELKKIAWYMDEPNGDPSAIALYFVDKLAAKHVKAVLSGEGADELFGGYTIYQTAISSKKLQSIPKPILKIASKTMNKLKLRGANYLNRASSDVSDWYYTNAYASAFSIKERKMLLKDCSKNIKSPQEIIAGTYNEADNDKVDDCAKMQYADLNYWIIGDILMKGDKMSMANSLETRVPFLDKEIWNLAKGLPTKEKISETQTKIALRDAAKKTIPQSWANKKKLGFPVPMSDWLREEKYYTIVRQAFEGETSKKYFNNDYLLKLLEDHKNNKVDNSRKIWIVFMFLLWHEVYFENQD